MSGEAEDGVVAWVAEALAALGGVRARRMFGGHGVFKDGLMFAIVVGNRLYLKTDAGNRDAFLAAGLEPFSYEARGRRVRLSYREAPAEALDDPDVLLAWARDAVAAALRPRRPKGGN